MAAPTMESMDCDMGSSQQQQVAQQQSAITVAGTLALGAQEEVVMMPPPQMPPPHAPHPPGTQPQYVLSPMAPPPNPPPPSQAGAAAAMAVENPYCHLANFDIEKKIGRGQFSVVYRAKCKINSAIMALKKVQVMVVPPTVCSALCTY